MLLLGIVEVLCGLLMSMVFNLIDVLLNVNYIGILVWVVGFGFVLCYGNDIIKNLINDVFYVVIFIVKVVICFVLLGIFGLVFFILVIIGFEILWGYVQLLLVLVGCMLLVVLVINLLLVFWKICCNFYLLVFICLCESGVYVFFICSFVVNILVNMVLCEKLNLDCDIYLVFILLGVIINMVGVVIIIIVLMLVVVYMLNILVDLLMVLLLSVVVLLCVCGVFGVVGGLLLLILLVCNMFGILNDVVM